MLSRYSDALFLRFGGGDPIRADALQARFRSAQLRLVLATYIPVLLAVLILVVHRPVSVDTVAQSDQRTAVEAYATRYVDTYLKDPSDSAAIKQFYDGDVPATALPPGGRALRASSALPGAVVDGFQTWSAVIDAEIPKAANSASMVPVALQVYLSIDRNHLFRAIALPAARPDRAPGESVQLATQTQIAQGRPVFNTVYGFLNALLLGQGDLAPFVSASSTLRAALPPRFSAMEIEWMQTNSDLATAQDVPPKADGVQVTVRAVLQTASGVLLPMDFPLLMSVAAGHWQVDRINDSPTVIPPDDAGLVVPSTTAAVPAMTVPLFTANAPEGSSQK